MAFRYDEVVPWGRSHAEYLDMFALSEGDLAGRVLGCGDGPASFNCEQRARGGRVLSVDPLYAFDARAIRRRIDATYRDVMAQTRRERHRFVWERIASPDELGRARMAAMNAFLADYEGGRGSGHYLAGELPALPLADASFDLALCSHLLLFYAEQLSADFHRAALAELCRVAGEVRVFPVVDVNGAPSPHLQPTLAWLRGAGHHAEVVRVPYEFQRGGDQMLRIR